MSVLCKKPVILAGRSFGCGQCMPCRLNHRRIWSHRLMLEAAQYEDNAFVTLTYADDMLPYDGSVVPKHLQDWLKRFRRGLEPHRIRFFAVGEYGDTSLRPHYHVALFNFSSCRYGQSRYGVYRNCCVACDYVRDTWKFGNVYLGALEPSSAAYMCGYVTKKMMSKGDARLEGRHPEFSRMSLRPGIGGDFMYDVADPHLRYDIVKRTGDVSSVLSHGQKGMPLGRYLTKRLRRFVGEKEETPDGVLEKVDAEMLPLRLSAAKDNVDPSIRSRLIALNAGKVARLEARDRLYRRKGSL